MAKKHEEFEVEAVRNTNKVKKMVKQGWEILSTEPGLFGLAPTYMMRRPNPKYKPKK